MLGRRRLFVRSLQKSLQLMPRALLLLALLLALGRSAEAQRTTFISQLGNNSSGSGARWTLVQHAHNYTCTATAPGDSPCTVTVTSTGAGHLLLLLSSAFQSGTSAQTTPTFRSASGDGLWTHCPSNVAASGNNSNLAFEATDCAYILSSTGGATSVSFTWNLKANTTTANIDVEFLEVSRSTGTAILDASGSTSNNNCSTGSCIGPALTLNGASEFVAQWIAHSDGCSAISGASYTNPFDNDTSNVFGTFAGALNQSSAPAQTWTCSTTGGTPYTAMGAIGFM